jgi:hypothetical protein
VSSAAITKRHPKSFIDETGEVDLKIVQARDLQRSFSVLTTSGCEELIDHAGANIILDHNPNDAEPRAP